MGTPANWQLAVSSRSIGNPSLVMPISTLYASAEKINSDGFCAFQPNRAMRPSLPFRLGRPLMPRLLLAEEFEARLAVIAPSVMLSINPAPNTGVGTPEDDVAILNLGLEVLLTDVAARRVWMPADHEERVDSAVA